MVWNSEHVTEVQLRTLVVGVKDVHCRLYPWMCRTLGGTVCARRIRIRARRGGGGGCGGAAHAARVASLCCDPARARPPTRAAAGRRARQPRAAPRGPRRDGPAAGRSAPAARLKCTESDRGHGPSRSVVGPTATRTHRNKKMQTYRILVPRSHPIKPGASHEHACTAQTGKHA